MSYYCKGGICPRAKKCLRAEAWDTFPKNGTTDGVWFVPENTCIKNNYEDGVFKTDLKNKTMDKIIAESFTENCSITMPAGQYLTIYKEIQRLEYENEWLKKEYESLKQKLEVK